MRTLALALMVAACGGTEEPPPTVMTPTLTRVEAEVFKVSCGISSACHEGVAAQKGLDLSGDTHAKLVGVMSAQKPGALLVKAGSPDESYLMDKILGRNLPAPTGAERNDPMPAPRGVTEADRVELVRAWIAAGAKDD